MRHTPRPGSRTTTGEVTLCVCHPGKFVGARSLRADGDGEGGAGVTGAAATRHAPARAKRARRHGVKPPSFPAPPPCRQPSNLSAGPPVPPYDGPRMEETDEALMAAVAGGDAAALSALYDRYERPTFNLILRLAGRRDVAEELMQEAFTRLWTTARLFRGERGSFKPWLFTIALNLTRSELSRKRYRVRHLEPEAAEELPALTAGPELLAVRAQEAQRVVAALARLSPLLREIVVLRIYQQLKFAEIARMTGAPEGTLKARFHRAVAELRVLLGVKESPCA